MDEKAMNEPEWLSEARKYIGVKEIPGVNHHPLIISWWKKIKRGGIKTDEVPWCAAFVGAMLEDVDIVSSRFESAKSYLQWGRPIEYPVPGCIVVFSRTGGGHVGFAVGKDSRGNLLVLGGNQSDEVNIRTFSRERVTGYRWPLAVPVPSPNTLPLVTAAAPTSDKEA
jgi:uncharacterized protein (TIGR02594 family)